MKMPKSAPDKIKVRSMTGFGVANCDFVDYKISCEIRAVNNRYKDLSIYLAPELKSLELATQKKLQTITLRGKITVRAEFQAIKKQNEQKVLDKGSCLNYLQILHELKDAFDEAGEKITSKALNWQDLLEFLQLPDIYQREQIAYPNLERDFLYVLDGALDGFLEMKAVEGRNIAIDIAEHAHLIEEKVNALEKHSPKIVQRYRENLLKKLKEYLQEINIDENRLLQEVLIY